MKPGSQSVTYIYIYFTVVTAVRVKTVVRKIMQPLRKKITQPLFLIIKKKIVKCNLAHLTTDVMFSGQRFAILAMCFGEVAQFSLTRACMIFFVERLRDFCVERLRDVLVWRGCMILSLAHNGA